MPTNTTPQRSRRHRIGRVAALTVAAATLGFGAAQASPAGASTPAVKAVAAAPAVAPAANPAPALASWRLVGIFPDPATCAIAGATTGRPFYCSFYFFFWGLNVWQ